MSEWPGESKKPPTEFGDVGENDAFGVVFRVVLGIAHRPALLSDAGVQLSEETDGSREEKGTEVWRLMG
jgi:hypothetical protein